MSFKHSLVDLGSNRTISLHIASALPVLINQMNRVLLYWFQMPEVIHQDNFVNTFAMGVLAFLYMCFHLLKYLISFPLEDLYVLVFLLQCLPSSDFVLYLLKGIWVQILKLQLNLLFLVSIPLLNLEYLLFRWRLLVKHLKYY